LDAGISCIVIALRLVGLRSLFWNNVETGDWFARASTFMQPLCPSPTFPLDPLRNPAPHLRPNLTGDTAMADVLFLVLGTGAFALFGTYATLLRKV
jgi:hypothetical protein